MNIPVKILEKYNMMPFETFKEMFDEETFYKTFLIQTDHIPNKIAENFVEVMVDDNVSMGSMKKFFKEVKSEYGAY